LEEESKQSKTVKFVKEAPEEEVVSNSEASFGRAEDSGNLGQSFEKIHLASYSESATKIWPKTFDHKFNLFKERVLEHYRNI